MPADPHHPHPWSGARGVLLIAVTYVYFLIFAQFGFLKRLDQLGITAAHLKLVMAAMAVGGILSSLLAPRLSFYGNQPASRLRCALAGCATATLLTLLPLTTLTAVAVSALIGLSLGLLTVTLVANLDLWIDPPALPGTPVPPASSTPLLVNVNRKLSTSRPLLQIGLGTGIGYLLCNTPWLFTASPIRIALCAALACLVGIPCTRTARTPSEPAADFVDRPAPPSFILLLAWFTAIIWLDSAAFFIIQNSPALKSGTWQGVAHLWRNGALHLAAALFSAWLLSRRGLATTLLCAFAALAAACFLLLHPAHAGPAALLYPIGVSLYSVALVAAPSFLLATSSRSDRARKAGWIYAVAGWVGSAMGIGMAQNLHRVPPAFVACAALLFLVPWLARTARLYLPKLVPQAAIVLASLGLALALQHLLTPSSGPPANALSPANPAGDGPVQRGRQIYIAEGCINCHSQYIRPHTADVLMWGPTRDLDAIRREHPPLIGNRRQGPDLSQVGSRRSPLWLRIHFINPRDVSYDSIMPSYAYLFADHRGDDLIAYMASLSSTESAEHLRSLSAEWKPNASPTPAAIGGSGPELFNHYCATCHLPTGRARVRWSSSFTRLPPNLATDKLLYVPKPNAADRIGRARVQKIAQIIKFGLPGTNMPGHEYLRDADIEGLALTVNGLRVTTTVP